MPETEFRWKRLFRFSLGTLLFAALCFAGFCAGYRSGIDSSQRELYLSTVRTETYHIGDLLAEGSSGSSDPKDAMTELADFIESSEFSEGTANAEEYDIHLWPEYERLVITANGEAQDDVAGVLESMREQRRRRLPENAVYLMAERAERVQRALAADSIWANLKERPHEHELVQAKFDETVARVTERWGTPDYAGAADDPGFPNWAIARAIRSWKRGGVQAYVALIENDDTEAVIVGARP